MCIGGYLWCRDCPPIGLVPNPIHPIPPYPHPYPHPVYSPPVKKPVPLTGVEVRAKVVDMCAEVSLVQRYENIEDVPIEATYVFPLEPRASVSSFYAQVNGKKIIGKLFEKEQARDRYDDAIASGNSAYMLEEVEDSANTFKTSIGNLPPKSEVVITVVYVTELEFNSDQKLEFVIPTNKKAFPDGNTYPRFAKPIVKNDSKIEYGLKVQVEFEMTSKIKSVSSPTHPIQYEAGDTPTQAKIVLANDDVGVPLVQNFEMNIALAEPNKPMVRIQGDTAMLALYPNLVTDDDPITEMIFVVDRSGSMSGAKIQRVKDTLQIFLRSLPLGTLFNVVGFGSNYVFLFEKSKEYDDDTLAAATKHVNDMKANLGGTNLLLPLKKILSSDPLEGIPRQIFVLTDGEVDNTEDCIDFVRFHSKTTRVFAFGIHGASPDLVNGIAKAGEGKAELILGNENIENKVMAQLKRALQPAFTNIRVEWGNLQATQTPLFLPPLFNGSRVIVYGTFPKTATKGNVTFKADTTNGPYTFTIEADPANVFPGDFIPKLAARSMIRDLEEGRRRSKYEKVAIDQKTKEQIIQLSIKSGMMSKYTAFVAVNELDKAVEGSMESRDVNQLSGVASGPGQAKGAFLTSHMSISGGFLGGYGGGPAPPPPPPGAAPPGAGNYLLQSTSASTRSSSPRGRAFFDSADFSMAPPPPPPAGRGPPPPPPPAGGGPPPPPSGPPPPPGAYPASLSSFASAPPPPPLGGGVLYGAAPSPSYQSAPPAAPAYRSAPSTSAVLFDRRSEMMQEMEELSSAPKAPQRQQQQQQQQQQPQQQKLSLNSMSLSNKKAEEAPASVSSDASGLKAIVMKQKAAGNFTEDVLQETKVPGLTMAKLRSNVPPALKSIPAAVLDQILVILLVCGLFQKRHAVDKEQWELVEKKGMTWAKKEAKKAGMPDDLDWKSFAVELASSVGVN